MQGQSKKGITSIHAFLELLVNRINLLEEKTREIEERHTELQSGVYELKTEFDELISS